MRPKRCRFSNPLSDWFLVIFSRLLACVGMTVKSRKKAPHSATNASSVSCPLMLCSLISNWRRRE
ncbi:hypothetical protein DPMN_155777 [Dreissena polymorpha]|uniref:Secreted protein n=1 Tax=Dreissena polymorpha TaxID=45954 RepID=A0A9D4FRV2_DREPO|nr:hypothetical protein DPMN_155777 [Dreissena polymorpha]